MKLYELILFTLFGTALLGFIGWAAWNHVPEPKQQTQMISKTIIMKESAIEQRMGIDVFANEILRQKSTTIYYLVAEDGTVSEVGLSDFARVNVGDEFAARNWRLK